MLADLEHATFQFTDERSTFTAIEDYDAMERLLGPLSDNKPAAEPKPEPQPKPTAEPEAESTTEAQPTAEVAKPTIPSATATGERPTHYAAYWLQPGAHSRASPLRYCPVRWPW